MHLLVCESEDDIAVQVSHALSQETVLVPGIGHADHQPGQPEPFLLIYDLYPQQKTVWIDAEQGRCGGAAYPVLPGGNLCVRGRSTRFEVTRELCLLVLEGCKLAREVV